jgi:hypothetical protein
MFLPVRSITLKEDAMFKKRVLFSLTMSSIALVSLTISSFTISASPLSSEMTGSLHQRNGSIHASNTYHLDCFRRHYNFNYEKSLIPEDASNYFMNRS